MSRIPVNNSLRIEKRKRKKADTQIRRELPSTSDINAIIAQYLIDNPVSGGSVQKLTAFTSGRITAGATGDILTVPAVSGKTYKITTLATDSPSGQSGMTLTVDGVDVFSNETLVDASPSAPATSSIFGVSSEFQSSIVGAGVRVLPSITCSSFTLTKVSGNTSQNIDYAYETLEDI